MACNCSEVNLPTPGRPIATRCGKFTDGTVEDSGKVEFGERETVDNTCSGLEMAPHANKWSPLDGVHK